MIGDIIVAARRYEGVRVVAGVENVGSGRERMFVVRFVVGDDIGEGKGTFKVGWRGHGLVDMYNSRG